MVLTLVFGVWLLIEYAWVAFGSMLWLHIKLLLIGLLVIYHFYCGKLVRQFAEDNNQHSHVWYRWFNELPVLILFAVVLLAVLKPT